MGTDPINALSTVLAFSLLEGPSLIEAIDGQCFGSVATVIRRLEELHALGLRKVIGWFHFGNMPYESVRRSMQLTASNVIPSFL